MRAKETTLEDLDSGVEVGMKVHSEIGTGSEDLARELGRFDDDVFRGVGSPSQGGSGWVKESRDFRLTVCRSHQ